jgi:DNA (cytosine-5)-methyltransferase 1
MKEPLRTQTTENRFALVAPVLTECANASSPRCMPAGEPLRTICAATKGGHHALVTAFLAKHYGGVVGTSLQVPSGTVTTVDHHSLVSANLVRHFGQSVGSAAGEPIGTVLPGGMGKTGLVTSHLVKLRGTCRDGQSVTEPLHTISAQGTHFGEVRAFLLKYYGSDQDPKLREPLHTVTTKDRFGLVTVRGAEYRIVDIGMRMLSPRELFRAQGFPENYIIDRDAGRPITKTEQVAKCGNSVCPPMSEVLVRANLTSSERARVAV